MTFLGATGVSHNSYSKGSESFFFFASVPLGSPMPHGTKFMPGKNCLGDNMLKTL